jgi:hypothetical protein
VCSSDLFLAGHVHPSKPNGDVRHIGRTIEITGPALLESEAFGVLTIDNGGLAYNVVRNSVHAIVTSPVKNTYSTMNFDQSVFEVRLISFWENLTYFHLSGAVNCNLTFRRKIAHGWLWATAVLLPAGTYRIRLTGDAEDDIKFCVGEPGRVLEETANLEIMGWVGPIWCITAIIFCFVTLASMFLTRQVKWLDSAWRFLNGAECTQSRSGMYTGPVFLGYCLGKQDSLECLSLLFMVLYGLIGPLQITTIEGVYSIQTVYGYFANRTYIYDCVAQLYGGWYFGLICPGFFLLYSYRSFAWNWSLACELVVGTYLILKGIYQWEAIGADWLSNWTWRRLSPAFHVIPIILIVLLIARIWKKRSIGVPGFEKCCTVVNMV